MSDGDIPEKDRRLVAVVSIIADRDEKIEQLQRERDELKAALSVSNTAHHEIKMAAVAEWKAKAEQLQRERDDIHTLWLKCCSNSVALVHQHDELKAHAALSDSAIAAIRELLKHHNVPTAAFIDDHVGNAIAQRDEANTTVAHLQAQLASVAGGKERQDDQPR